MSTRRQVDDFSSESSHALLDLSSQHGSGGVRRNSISLNGFRGPTLRDELSEAPSLAYPENAPIIAPFARRLWRYLLLCNIGTIVLLLGSILVLSFLWFGNNSNIHWTAVMINGWVGQAVTLSTLAIRLAVSTQASTAVAMLAAIRLESKQGRGVLLANMPAISVARYGNTGPLTSILLFKNDVSWTKCGIVLPLMAIVAFCTLISQFTSTLLLWDVRSGAVRGFSHDTLGPVGMSIKDYTQNYFTTMTRADYFWTSSPREFPSLAQSFPTFAEYNAKPQEQTPSIADTGPTIRALLPISSQLDRSMVSTFEGIAAVFDARVSCVRPVLTDWKFAPGPSQEDNDTIYLEGYAKPSELTEELTEILRFNQSEPGIFFRCTTDDMLFVTEPLLKVCFFKQTNGGLINILDPSFNSSLGYRFYDGFPGTGHPTWVAFTDDQVWPVELGHTFLVIRARGNSTLDVSPDDTFELSGFSLQNRGVWVDFTAPDLRWTSDVNISAEISMTMCYDAWYDAIGYDRIKHLQEYPIFASRSSNSSEPSLGWDSQRKSYDTASIRSQLAACAENDIDRGILELDVGRLKQNQQLRSGLWAPDRNFLFYDGYGLDFWFPSTNSNLDFESGLIRSEDTLDLLFNHTMNETYDFITKLMWGPFHGRTGGKSFEIISLCRNCSRYGDDIHTFDGVSYKALNPILDAIFRDTLIETDNPALAWQALTTTIARMAYYDWLPTFDSYAPITTTSMVPCQVPKYHTGFTIVAVNLAVHLSLFIVITIWFYNATKTSLLNNAWQAVAQLNSRETEKIFHRATTATDAEVKKWIKEGQEPRRRFRIVGDGQSDRVHLS